MSETLIICTNTECKKEFPSPIAFEDKESFESATMYENITNCPHCGKKVTFGKKNMRFIDR